LSFLIKPHQIVIYLKNDAAGLARRFQGVSFMRKSVFVLAVIGAACSSMAFAAEVTKDKAHIPAVKATTMSDAQMDKVTAGDAGGVPNLGHDNTSGLARGAGIGALGNSGRITPNGSGRFGSP
jgi:hypothetical protein